MDAVNHSSSLTVSYSVVIRTLGNTGEKYKALLESIKAQSVQPEEVIVVIPEGYSLDYSLGNEIIIQSPKGMVTQRAAGIEAAKSEFILVIDDDIEFKADFVARLASFQKDNNLDCVLPGEGYLRQEDTTIKFKYPFNIRLKYAFTGRMFQTKKTSKYIDVITATAGHRVYCGCNRIDQCYYSQTGNFQCFFINTDKARQVNFNKEVWLQQGSLSDYAIYDDATFFYHFYLQGYNIAYALRARYRHLDAAAGRRAKNKVDVKRIRYYSVARNRTVFWFRFLYQPSDNFFRKLKVLFGGIYAFVNYTLYSIIVNSFPKYWPVISAMAQGFKEAFSIIRRNELPPHGLKFRVD